MPSRAKGIIDGNVVKILTEKYRQITKRIRQFGHTGTHGHKYTKSCTPREELRHLSIDESIGNTVRLRHGWHITVELL